MIAVDIFRWFTRSTGVAGSIVVVVNMIKIWLGQCNFRNFTDNTKTTPTQSATERQFFFWLGERNGCLYQTQIFGFIGRLVHTKMNEAKKRKEKQNDKERYNMRDVDHLGMCVHFGSKIKILFWFFSFLFVPVPSNFGIRASADTSKMVDSLDLVMTAFSAVVSR
jgi:hypothetical protein